MAITHTLTLNWNRGSEQIAKSVAVTGDDAGEQNTDVGLTALQANKEVAITIDVSALLALYISSDVALTVKTNSSGSPADTLTVAIGKPLVWYTGCGLPNPFASATDVTKLFLTNGTNAVGTAKIRVLQDATP